MDKKLFVHVFNGVRFNLCSPAKFRELNKRLADLTIPFAEEPPEGWSPLEPLFEQPSRFAIASEDSKKMRDALIEVLPRILKQSLHSDDKAAPQHAYYVSRLIQACHASAVSGHPLTFE